MTTDSTYTTMKAKQTYPNETSRPRCWFNSAASSAACCLYQSGMCRATSAQNALVWLFSMVWHSSWTMT